MITGVTEITEFYTKSDMSRWTRAHADTPGITWSVFPGPGGTMIVVEHEEDRCTLAAARPAPAAVEPAAVEPVGVPVEPVAAPVEVSAHSTDSLQARRSSWARAFA